jgi:hypothetical protein
MTPEEKAIKLYEKYDLLFKAPFKKHKDTKQCALIAVEEIINSNPIVKIRFEKNNCSWIESKSNINYWQEVKQEIEKL